MKKNAETKQMDEGMAALGGEGKARRARPRGRIKQLMPRSVGGLLPTGGDGGDDSVASGTDGGSISGSQDSLAPPEDTGSEAEEFQEAVVAEERVLERAAALAWPYATGQILINRSAGTLDVRCFLCEGSIDRSWKRKANAKQLYTLAHGRPLGSHMAWACLPCSGDQAEHLLQYSIECLDRDVRRQLRVEAMAEGNMAELFDKEGLARDDEEDGEPIGVPENKLALQRLRLTLGVA